MSSSQQDRNRQWVAKRPTLPEFSPEARAFTEQYPALRLHVYCTMGGVALTASVDHLDPKGRLHVTQVARARWKPAEVSERLVVEWGERALRRWLEDNPATPDPPR